MSPSRRSFITSAAAAGLAATGLPRTLSELMPLGSPDPEDRFTRSAPPLDGYDPWIEVNPSHLLGNAREIGRVTEGRPIMAVIKNNGYGLGLERVGVVLDRAPEVAGLGVVRVDEAVRLRDAGVRKPILLLTRAADSEIREMVRLNVRLSPYSDGDGDRLEDLSQELQRPVPVHLYLDTGMSRLGMPYHRALPWIADLIRRPGIRVEGTFMGFTEDSEFDREQLRRFNELASEARDEGLPLGRLHAASTTHVTFMPEAYLDMVRPGLMLFGAQASGGREAGVLDLTPALRVRARVLRVERIRPGDTVSYGRRYEATDHTWVATIPLGHSDGYPRQAVEGCRVLIGDRTYPVIGAVSASHCIVEIGPEQTVRQGEIATLMGPDHPDIHPNELAEQASRSVYDILMHLSPGLPGREWDGADPAEARTG